MNSAFHARPSTPASAGLSPTIRCPTWRCPAGRKPCRSSRNSCRRRRNICARPPSSAAAGRHLRPGLSDGEELLRHQGIQLFGSLCAVRRPSRRPDRRRQAVRACVEQERTVAHQGSRDDAAAADCARPLQRQARRHDLSFCGVSLNMGASSTKTECRAMRGIWAVRRYHAGGGLLLYCAMRDGHAAPLCNCGSQGNVSTSRLPFCAATR